ncbi:ankyrin [Sistotremastrum niveocremeum HHB9708]|uniref:Ankyrin n=1 Tax=Sistotremastrum niveocremeum HHB9708 TaxID=1314777 RepID=A0A164UEY0_9AGAM|nr:ankyrin [Sistotremastrum niveocremeum HHB9708]
MSDDKGASNNERLLYAARTDNEDLLLEIFEEPETFDINFKDGLGNTALHYASVNGSVNVLEHILSHEDCDVDPQNRLNKSTPLHLALSISEAELRQYIVESLLEAGADTTIQDVKGDTVLDLLGEKDEELRLAIRRAQAEADIAQDDIAHDDDLGSDVASDSD